MRSLEIILASLNVAVSTCGSGVLGLASVSETSSLSRTFHFSLTSLLAILPLHREASLAPAKTSNHGMAGFCFFFPEGLEALEGLDLVEEGLEESVAPEGGREEDLVVEEVGRLEEAGRLEDGLEPVPLAEDEGRLDGLLMPESRVR